MIYASYGICNDDASYGICNDEPIILVENVKTLQKGTEICKTFKEYFVNITYELDMYNW